MKYSLPPFLEGIFDQDPYVRWLGRKAIAHVRRDRARGNPSATRESYMVAIHAAVTRCEGRCEYTGDPLRWVLASKYDNERSKTEGRHYKAAMWDLPTLDHVGDGLGAPEFRICSWQVNGAKADLAINQFHNLCLKVLRHAGKLPDPAAGFSAK